MFRNEILPFVLFLSFTSVTTAFAAESKRPDASLLNDLEMGKQAGEAPERPYDGSLWRERWQFMEAYYRAGEAKLAVFEKYVPVLGTDEILDFLEAVYPQCHGQSHELGEAIFGHYQSIGPALNACQSRCTSGCMHGIMRAAFTDTSFESVKRQMVDFCKQGEMAEIHKPGNCAHGIGHTLMMVLGRDVPQALEACKNFLESAMVYYCATGVFMEYFMTDQDVREAGEREGAVSPHFPCDTYTEFPAACYRYKMPKMLKDADGEIKKLIEGCLAVSDLAVRRGCFHGLGAVLTQPVSQEPRALYDVCRHGTPEEQITCIEGAVEKLADYDESIAMNACRTLEGKNAQVCEAAAKGKMYRLDKSTMNLYYEPPQA